MVSFKVMCSKRDGSPPAAGTAVCGLEREHQFVRHGAKLAHLGIHFEPSDSVVVMPLTLGARLC